MVEQRTAGRNIEIDDEAYSRLSRAKKRGESFSEVVMRLTSTKVEALQRRGEMEIVTSDGKRLAVRVEQGKCSGAESCVTLAPEVFSLDPSQLGRYHDEPLGMKEVGENQIESSYIMRAAKSCPYEAIHVRDMDSGLEICP